MYLTCLFSLCAVQSSIFKRAYYRFHNLPKIYYYVTGNRLITEHIVTQGACVTILVVITKTALIKKRVWEYSGKEMSSLVVQCGYTVDELMSNSLRICT